MLFRLKQCAFLKMNKNISYVLILSLFYFMPLFAHAQQEVNNDLSLKYLVRKSTIVSGKMPVVILLHGFGSNETDLFTLKDSFPGKYLIVSARAPMNVGPDAYQWFGNQTVRGAVEGNPADLKRGRQKIKLFIAEVVKKYHADAAQVYVLGFSQGAMMSYEVGLTSPELVKGIAPMSGKIFNSLKPDIKVSSSLKHLKVFIGHGDADNRVILGSATNAAAYLKKLGISPSLHIYKGVTHSISEQEISDLIKWLN